MASYGYHNHLIGNLLAPGNTAGTGGSATLAACKFYLPVKAVLVGIYATATARHLGRRRGDQRAGGLGQGDDLGDHHRLRDPFWVEHQHPRELREARGGYHLPTVPQRDQHEEHRGSLGAVGVPNDESLKGARHERAQIRLPQPHGGHPGIPGTRSPGTAPPGPSPAASSTCRCTPIWWASTVARPVSATGGTSTLNVLAGSSKVTTSGLALSSGTTSAANAVILTSYISSDAGTLFSLVENTTNSVAIVNPAVQLWFRPQIE